MSSDQGTDPQILAYNRNAWNEQVAAKNEWTVPVTEDQIAAARQGQWQVLLTPCAPVPRTWFPNPMAGTKILGLACGGGQQGPIFAAAGATVTVFDNSESQLDQDRLVAQRDGLTVETVQGDMANLEVFGENTFDLIFHPCSNCFVPDVRPVWKEAFRVLKPGGYLLSGFTNPLRYLFDDDLLQEGQFVVRYKIPYSDLTSISEEQKQKYAAENEPYAFGHTLEDQIGGQVDAGFHIVGLYEDQYDETDKLSHYIASFMATRSLKPQTQS